MRPARPLVGLQRRSRHPPEWSRPIEDQACNRRVPKWRREPRHRNHRPCGDQIWRNFLKALTLRLGAWAPGNDGRTARLGDQMNVTAR